MDQERLDVLLAEAWRHAPGYRASSNEFMPAINPTLGFRAVGGWIDWQQTV